MSENFAAELHRRATTALQAGRADAQGEGDRVPVGQYTDEAIARDERRLLQRHPQPVAASASLASSGAWLSLTHTGVPLLLVRQESGQVQAFLNVCRHRGARVVPEGSGSEARAFVCPYHAWTYKPDGALRGVPESFGFPCLKQDASGLRRLATVERAGVVWVVCDPSQADSDPARAWARSWTTSSRWPGCARPWPMRRARTRSKPTGSCWSTVPSRPTTSRWRTARPSPTCSCTTCRSSTSST